MEQNLNLQKALCDYLLYKWIDQIPYIDDNNLYEEMYNKYFIDKYNIDMLNGELCISSSNPKAALIELNNILDPKKHSVLLSLVLRSVFGSLTNKETKQMNTLMEQILFN
jgi:hypothetical protein